MLNAANEVAVARFLDGELGFTGIAGWWSEPWTVSISARRTVSTSCLQWMRGIAEQQLRRVV